MRLITCLLVCLTAVLTTTSGSSKQPNIILLITDDMNMDMIAAYGNEQIQTPNLDRLVDSGCSFMNAYNMGAWSPAVCIPSRTMLNTGVKLWTAQANLYKWSKPLLSELIAQNGYETYFTGKWHTATGSKVDDVFDHVGLKTEGQLPTNTVASSYSPFDKARGGFWTEEGHITELTTNDVIQFIESGSNDTKPFFIYAGFNVPHVPRQAAKKYFELYPKDTIKLPPNLPETSEDVEMKWAKRVTPQLAKGRRQENYAVMTHFDDQLGRILEALDASPARDDTILIFMSDHGNNLGENGVTGKENLYNLSMQGPLILRGPGIPKGQRLEAPVYLQDITPTILNYVGAPIPIHMEFDNLSPMIEGKTDMLHETIYGAFEAKMRCLVMREHKLIRYYKPEGKVDRLFDLRNDPAEAHDQSLNPEYQQKLVFMRERLIEEARKHNDPKEDV